MTVGRTRSGFAGPTARLGPSRLGVVGRLAIESADTVSKAL